KTSRLNVNITMKQILKVIMMDDFEGKITHLRDTIRDIPDIYKGNREELDKLEGETQDLLHLIEFNNLNASEGFKVYKELQKVKRRRRELKNQNEFIETIYITIQSMKYKNLKSINDGIGDVRKIIKCHSYRKYSYRVRLDLQFTLE